MQFNLKRVSDLVLGFAALVAVSCNKDSDPSPYPKQAAIEYRVSLLSGPNLTTEVVYDNATGGTTLLEDVTLPFSNKSSGKFDQFDGVAFSASSSTPGSLKIEIYVEGKLADTETLQSQSFISGAIAYAFE